MNTYFNHTYPKVKEKDTSEGVSFGVFILGLFELLLSMADKLIAFFTSAKVRKIAKVVITLLCLIAFIGVIGSVEAESMSLGGGIIASIMLFTVEVLCVR